MWDIYIFIKFLFTFAAYLTCIDIETDNTSARKNKKHNLTSSRCYFTNMRTFANVNSLYNLIGKSKNWLRAKKAQVHWIDRIKEYLVNVVYLELRTCKYPKWPKRSRVTGTSDPNVFHNLWHWYSHMTHPWLWDMKRLLWVQGLICSALLEWKFLVLEEEIPTK